MPDEGIPVQTTFAAPLHHPPSTDRGDGFASFNLMDMSTSSSSTDSPRTGARRSFRTAKPVNVRVQQFTPASASSPCVHQLGRPARLRGPGATGRLGPICTNRLG